MAASSVEVRVRFFGKARELMACEEARAVLPVSIHYRDLKQRLFNEMYSGLAQIETACILAIDHRYLSDETTVRLNPSSEIAIIPPLSGG